MADKFNIVVLDAYENLFSFHEEHRRVQRQFELRAGANEGTADGLSAALAPGKLERYQSWRGLQLFCLFQQQYTASYNRQHLSSDTSGLL